MKNEISILFSSRMNKYALVGAAERCRRRVAEADAAHINMYKYKAVISNAISLSD